MRRKSKATAAALALLFLLSVVLTLPLSLHLADAVEDRRDALLNVWITAWDGHQLVGDPGHFFDANIFHPYARTLAYSELLLGNGLLALPITAATGNPVLGYNLALLLSFVLTGFGTYLLVLKLTRSAAAGLVAGIVCTFGAYRMTNLAQAQLLASQWIPFALLALYQLTEQRQPLAPSFLPPPGSPGLPTRAGRLRHAATLVLFFCLQALSSFYYAFLLAFALLIVGAGIYLRARAAPEGPSPGEEAESGPFAPARPDPMPRAVPAAKGRRPLALYLLLAAGCALLILVPFVLPYLQVQREMGFERSLAESEPFSASLRQYVMVPPGSVLYGGWLPSDDTPVAGGYPVDALWPGLFASALALWGLVRGREGARWDFSLLLLASFCLSLGPRLYLAPGQPASLDVPLPYAWLYAVVPGFKALRAPVRFDALVTLSVAVLAGFGVAALSRAGSGQVVKVRRWLPVLGACGLSLVVLEHAVWPAAHAEKVPVGDQVPAVVRWLADQPRGPIIELPMAFAAGPQTGPQLEYQYLSTYHWQPTPDGYSGFVPPKHGQIAYEMERFPSERSLSLLQALDIRLVVVHAARYAADRWQDMEASLSQAADLELIETFGADRVYRVRSTGSEPHALASESLQVGGYLADRAPAGEVYTAYVTAVNRGSRSFAVPPTVQIRPKVVWESAGDRLDAQVSADVPLVTSPHGGAAVIAVSLAAPSAPGSYHLTLSEEDGPLGSWRVEGDVAVVDSSAAGGGGALAFPVPVQLAAWTLPAMAQRGQPLSVGLVWRALGKIDAYYSTYVKVIDSEGTTVASWDGQPRNGQAPTLLWVPGEAIDDVVSVAVPEDVAPGDYTVEVGMYRAEDLARCLTLDQDGLPLDRIVLGSVRVQP